MCYTMKVAFERFRQNSFVGEIFRGFLRVMRTMEYAGVAQLAEQLICNQQVAGSSPITSSMRDKETCPLALRESSRVAKGDRL